MEFPSIQIQGNIISWEIIHNIKNDSANFQKLADFGFAKNVSIRDEIGYAWALLKSYYNTFKLKQSRLNVDATGTTETREDWMLPFFKTLSYEPEKSSAELHNEKSYAVSHRDASRNGFPIHIAGCNESIDRKPVSGTLRISPHALVQEYLNVAPQHLYALVTNGKVLRLLRDSTSLTKLTFLQFDIEKMFEEDLYADFAILFRLLHVSRMPKSQDDAETSIIDHYHQETLNTGTRIRDKLSKAVKEVIEDMAKALLNHQDNNDFIDQIKTLNYKGEDFYHDLLRFIYRFLFITVIEERKLLFADDKTDETKRLREIYYNFYSLKRIRQLASRSFFDNDAETDLWQSMAVTFKLFEPHGFGKKLAINPLMGDLFGREVYKYDLEKLRICNSDLLRIIRKLTVFQNEQNILTSINYADLNVEEFGSVYEGLLEQTWNFNLLNVKPIFDFGKSTARSSSGSHYTPDDLVQPLIKHSLDYQIADKMKLVNGEKRVVSGDWKTVNTKYPNLKNDINYLIIKLLQIYDKELSGFGSLEKSNEHSRTDLLIDQVISKGRVVWDDFTTSPLCSLHSGEHCRRLGTERKKGIQSISENSQWQSEGNGNSSDIGSESELVFSQSNRSDFERIRNSQQANSTTSKINLTENQLTKIWLHLPVSTRNNLITPHHLQLASNHLLSLKVCDIACGSGHILLSAARRIGIELARLRTGEEQPSPEAQRLGVRDAILNCIYGVDKNPMAVELCKISLWLEAHVPGQSLRFLDHRIKCGDSIVGLAHLNEPENGISSEAFKHLPDDDKDVAKRFRDGNNRDLKSRK